jgi:hypothetical protein
MAPNNPFYDWLNYYGGTNPLTGAPQNWYDTPTSKIDVGQTLPQGEYERFLSKAGFGGFDRQAQFARSLYDRTQSGYAAAKLNNPNLFYRDYLNTLGRTSSRTSTPRSKISSPPCRVKPAWFRGVDMGRSWLGSSIRGLASQFADLPPIAQAAAAPPPTRATIPALEPLSGFGGHQIIDMPQHERDYPAPVNGAGGDRTGPRSACCRHVVSR